MSQPTLPVRIPAPAPPVRAKVVAISPCIPPWTAEVEIDRLARTETIWFRGYRVGDVILVERRSSGQSSFWADMQDPGGGSWTE